MPDKNSPGPSKGLSNAKDSLEGDDDSNLVVEIPASALPVEEEKALLPARMMNEFVYCPRLFYYEHVEGIFLHNADTKRGEALHKRVDAGSGQLPAASEGGDNADEVVEPSQSDGQETVHSRSVSLGSDRLGVTAKLDLAEVTLTTSDGATTVSVCPVDYKAGAPREAKDGGLELWDTDRMQLGLQCLLLRDNGYVCTGGIIYYRATKQRVRLQLSPELESWILENIEAARTCINNPIPSPLVDSPKCNRCSLAPICLPDETAFLAHITEPVPESADSEQTAAKPGIIRRLIASRDESRTLYLNTPGTYVGRSGEVLRIKDKDKEKPLDEVRISDIAHVCLFGNIQITTQSIQTLCDNEIPITYFSSGGWFYGITRGHGLTNIYSRIQQFTSAASPSACLALATTLVSGKIRNQRTMLMRNHIEPPAAVINKLKTAIDYALAAQSLPELLGMEGAAASLYFQNFAGTIKAESPQGKLSGSTGGISGINFHFDKRNRRPPRDPVNALLSLSYSLLAKECTLAALSVGLDPYLGFYHQPRHGRPALALDLMEEFRPIIADSSVLTCLNNNMLGEQHFITAGNAVNLTPAGRRIFFQTFEKRINSLVTHPVFDYKVSYRRAIELQARLLARVLTGEIPRYIPFTTR
ncbi:MAG TPA: CRISPR-associated endonuclease Cas1 [Candidatus Methylacidiphilales bacterium]|nr:CRISPR-associated endonuclease Cas1 [Candidatus Methylacidiphilales bacterium]